METLENSELCRNHFPNTPPKVHVMEFAQHYMQALAHTGGTIFSSSSSVVATSPWPSPTDPTQMSLPPHHGYLPGQLGPLMNLCNLQEDVLVTCLAGMPLIEPSSVSSIRTPFMFKDDGAAQFRWVWSYCAVAGQNYSLPYGYYEQVQNLAIFPYFLYLHINFSV